MRIGVDKGSVYTKTKDIILRSIIRELGNEVEVKGLDTFGTKITINDKRYVVGEKGEFATDLLKSQTEATKNLIYTAIALSKPADMEKIDLVVGLPIGQYTRQKQAMKELLSEKSPITYSVGRDESRFIINRVEVFPEGAGAFYSLDTNKFTKSKVMIIDIGGLSVDVVVFIENKMAVYFTYQLGMMKLFSRLASELNRVFDTEYTEWDMHDVLINGCKVNGKLQDLHFLHELCNDHVDTIYRKIKIDFDVKTLDEIILVGGGGLFLHSALKDYMPQLWLPENYLTANVEGFDRIAEVIYA